MSRCGTVRSLSVAAASPGLRDSGIGAPLQSDPSCVPGRARGNSAPFSPLGYLGVTLLGPSARCTPRGDREMGTLCGHPTEGRREG